MEKTKTILNELFATQKLGVPATIGKPNPRTSLVAFVVIDSLKRILFATPRSTRKYTNIKANPQVSMLIDNRSNEIADFSDAVAVAAFGTAFELMKDRQNSIDDVYGQER